MGRRFRRFRRVVQQFVHVRRRIFRVCSCCDKVESSYEVEVVSVEKLFYGDIPGPRVIPLGCGRCERSAQSQEGWQSPEDTDTRSEVSEETGEAGNRCGIEKPKTDLHQNANKPKQANDERDNDCEISQHQEVDQKFHEKFPHPQNIPSGDQQFDHSTWDTWYTSYPIGWKIDSQFLDGDFGQRAYVRDRDNKTYFLKIKEEIKSHLELSHLADLQSRFVVRPWASFVRGDNRFTFMEYCPLGDLNHWLQSDTDRKYFTEEVAVNISSCIYMAVNFLHDAGVLHLNVNTTNILINYLGCPILCGFGSARSIRSCESSSIDYPLTSTYIPPERFQGRPPNRMTDFWAVACCLYAIIKGKSPFSRRSLAETKLNVSLAILPDLGGLSKTASGFLSSTLQLSWQNRLGVHGDIMAIYRHPLFYSINWYSVEFGHHKSPLLSICDILNNTTRTRDQRNSSLPIPQPLQVKKGSDSVTGLLVPSDGQIGRRPSHTRGNDKYSRAESSDSSDGCTPPVPPRRRIRRNVYKTVIKKRKFIPRDGGYIGDGEESEV